jgi:hypothetical protein
VASGEDQSTYVTLVSERCLLPDLDTMHLCAQTRRCIGKSSGSLCCTERPEGQSPRPRDVILWISNDAQAMFLARNFAVFIYLNSLANSYVSLLFMALFLIFASFRRA